MLETEIKLPVADRAAIRRRLRDLGFKTATPRLLERNLVFDTPDRRLRAASQLLRLRRKGRQWWLTWKGRPEGGTRHKVRQEIEVEIPQGGPLEEILKKLGYQVAFEYEKYRTEFQQRGRRGTAVLDETPIGNFLELEGSPAWIDRIAARLGFGSPDYLLASYGGLFLEWCRERGLEPDKMIFKRPGR